MDYSKVDIAEKSLKLEVYHIRLLLNNGIYKWVNPIFYKRITLKCFQKITCNKSKSSFNQVSIFEVWKHGEGIHCIIWLMEERDREREKKPLSKSWPSLWIMIPCLLI